VNPRWAKWFGKLEEVIQATGSYPNLHTSVGVWVVTQRRLRRAGELGPAELELLAGLPLWEWDPSTNPNRDKFDKRLEWFLEEVAKQGTSYFAIQGCLPGEDLYTRQWLNDLRNRRRDGLVSDGVCRTFEALPDWSWDEESWTFEARFRLLQKSARPGTILLEQIADSTTKTWVRSLMANRSTLSVGTIRRLEALPGWRWLSPTDDQQLRARFETALRSELISWTVEEWALLSKRMLPKNAAKLTDVGESIGLSREAARQIETKIYSRLLHPTHLIAFRKSPQCKKLPSMRRLSSSQIDGMEGFIEDMLR
jgi:hypothetical protein